MNLKKTKKIEYSVYLLSFVISLNQIMFILAKSILMGLMLLINLSGVIYNKFKINYDVVIDSILASLITIIVLIIYAITTEYNFITMLGDDLIININFCALLLSSVLLLITSNTPYVICRYLSAMPVLIVLGIDILVQIQLVIMTKYFPSEGGKYEVYVIGLVQSIGYLSILFLHLFSLN